jgi:anti-anti-sigma factor
MSNFTLSLRNENGTVFLRPAGYLDNLGAEQIVTASDRAVREGCRQIVCNCSQVRFINSVGISILVSMIQRMRDAGCAVGLTNVSKVHQTVFEIVGITRIVPVFGTERDAVRGLGGRR